MVVPLVFCSFLPIIFSKTKEQENNKKNLSYYITSFIIILFFLFLFVQFNLIIDYTILIFSPLLIIISIWFAIKLKINLYFIASLISILLLNIIVILNENFISVSQIAFLNLNFLIFLILLFISTKKNKKLKINVNDKISKEKERNVVLSLFIWPIFGSVVISVIFSFIFVFAFLLDAGMFAGFALIALPIYSYPFFYIIVLFYGLFRMYRKVKKEELNI